MCYTDTEMQMNTISANSKVFIPHYLLHIYVYCNIMIIQIVDKTFTMFRNSKHCNQSTSEECMWLLVIWREIWRGVSFSHSDVVSDHNKKSRIKRKVGTYTYYGASLLDMYLTSDINRPPTWHLDIFSMSKIHIYTGR